MEHKGNRAVPEEAWYIERPDFFSSIAYWYQRGLPRRFGELPSWPARSVPWENHHLVSRFREVETAAGGRVTVETQGFFGGRPALKWTAAGSDSRLCIPFDVAEAGRYAVRLTALTAPEYGRSDIAIDGTMVLRAIDFGSREAEEVDLLLGTHALSAGSHTLTFHAQPSQGEAPPRLAVEMLRLLALPPEAVREVKTENEAHFVRLGIGRATFAYRLAYGALPDSLQTLHEAGILEARYLNDENGFALVSWREGDFLVVESTREGGWKHRWQGLDARR
jgi:hypothetical protein